MDKLNQLMTDPKFDCRLVIQPNFVGVLKGTLYVRSVDEAKEWSIAFEDESIGGILKSLNNYIEP